MIPRKSFPRVVYPRISFGRKLKPGFHYYATNARNARNAVDANANVSDANATADARNATNASNAPHARTAKQRIHRTLDALPPLFFFVCFESMYVNYMLSAYAGCVFVIQATTSQM